MLIECTVVDMIELVDESRNFLPTGRQILSPSVKLHQSSLVVVFPLRCVRNEPVQLGLRVYSGQPAPSNGQVATISERAIRVPKYAMFALLDDEKENEDDKDTMASGRDNDDTAAAIKVVLKLEDNAKYVQVSERSFRLLLLLLTLLLLVPLQTTTSTLAAALATSSL